MRSIAAIPAIFLLFAFASCSKQMDDRVYIKFENISDRILQNPLIESYTREGQAIQLTLPGINPGQASGYVGFESMSAAGGAPFMSFHAIVDGTECGPGSWCGTGMYKMTPGHYTAEVQIVENYLIVTLKQ